MSVEALLIVLICASIGLGWHQARRPDSGPVTHWVAGWVAAGVGAILLVVRDEFPRAQLLAYPLGSLFPALLLSGALALAARPLPRWLLPAALVYGALRAGLAAAGLHTQAWAMSLAVEPFVVLAAALVVYRATPATDTALSQRLLAPSLCALAVVGVAHVAWMMRADTVPAGLLAMWVVAVPLLFGVQIHAEWERARRALRRAHEELEARVAERTAALRESETRYRVASELSSDLSFGLRVDLVDHLYDGWTSDAFPLMTGYTLEDLKGTGWISIIHPDDLDALRADVAAILAGRARELEVRILTRDGRTIRVHARLQVTRDEGEGRFRVVGAARDVTEARRAEEERRRLERAVLEAQRLESLAILAGGVAHDFNNQLTVILGNSRVLQGEAPPDSPLYARLARIRVAAEHGARLTQQMLAYSGNSALALKPLDLSQLLEEMADLMRAAVSERCRLELELSHRTPVEGDATQLQQVVLNLVTNASEALVGGEGQVSIRTGRTEQDAASLAGAAGTENPAPGPYVFLEVSDDGSGMDAAARERIFEPFFTTRFSGRGLGLAAVLGIVRAHRGVVHVRSEPGRGTSIRVLLPEAHAIAARVVDAGATSADDRRRGTVLVVDDQDSILELAQIFLERAGHRVITATGGRAGIELFRSHGHEIDVVLLDLAMPDADGEEVLREMQRLRPDVRVIISTGCGAGFMAERMGSGGVAGFVRKPYEPEEILAQIDRALAQRG